MTILIIPDQAWLEKHELTAMEDQNVTKIQGILNDIDLADHVDKLEQIVR